MWFSVLGFGFRLGLRLGLVLGFRRGLVCVKSLGEV